MWIYFYIYVGMSVVGAMIQANETVLSGRTSATYTESKLRAHIVFLFVMRVQVYEMEFPFWLRNKLTAEEHDANITIFF